VDLRHLIAHVALSYDRDHGTDLFHGLVPEDITVSEHDVAGLLESCAVPDACGPDVTEFCRQHLWDEECVLAASAPYRSVLGVIRWFQIQPRTHIALNTGRPESMRRVTLDSLNAIGASSRVRFDPELLFMRAEAGSVLDGKTKALDEIEALGLHVVAVVDNEPENLEAMAERRGSGDVLFLHADTGPLRGRDPGSVAGLRGVPRPLDVAHRRHQGARPEAPGIDGNLGAAGRDRDARALTGISRRART
jgi:hypothetical protein